jgi:hypothetical protein
MGTSLRPIATAILLVVLPASMTAQEPQRLGLNLSVAGTTLAGITYHVSDAVALRPSIGFQWYHDERPIPIGTRTLGQFGLNLDVLFPLQRAQAIRPYIGLSPSLWLNQNNLAGSTGTSRTITLGSLFGVFVRLLPRVHAFGQAELGYSITRGAGEHLDRVALSTTPIGLLVYLR